MENKAHSSIQAAWVTVEPVLILIDTLEERVPSYTYEHQGLLTTSVVAAVNQCCYVVPQQTLLNRCFSIMVEHKLIFQARMTPDVR